MKTLIKYSAAQLKRTGYMEEVWSEGVLSIAIGYCVSSNSYLVVWYNNNEPTHSKHRINTLAEAYKVASK